MGLDYTLDQNIYIILTHSLVVSAPSSQIFFYDMRSLAQDYPILTDYTLTFKFSSKPSTHHCIDLGLPALRAFLEFDCIARYVSD